MNINVFDKIWLPLNIFQCGLRHCTYEVGNISQDNILVAILNMKAVLPGARLKIVLALNKFYHFTKLEVPIFISLWEIDKTIFWQPFLNKKVAPPGVKTEDAISP